MSINKSVQANGMLTVEINRPEKRNAFDGETMEQLVDAFAEAEHDSNVRSVVLRGAGSVFCAGGDIHWMRSAASDGTELRQSKADLVAKLMRSIYACPLPTIALVHGAAFGGAVGMMACCDFVFSTNDLKWATSECKLGIVPACIAPYISQRVGYRKATQLFLSGQALTAEQGLEIGMIDQVFPTIDAMEDAITNVQSILVQASPSAQREAKRILRSFPAVEIEKQSRTSSLALAESWASADGMEGMTAFIEKRKPNWEL